jgi:hypothetical protein
MAHFAKLDENNIVTEIIVVNNGVIENLPFPDSEPIGVAFCQSLYGADTRWIQTSYNNSFRKNYAGVGYTYDADIDAFIPPKPNQYPSWILDVDTASWLPPVPRPTDSVYVWNESTISWVEVSKPFPSWVSQGNPPIWFAPVPYPVDGKKYKWDEPTLSWIEVV